MFAWHLTTSIYFHILPYNYLEFVFIYTFAINCCFPAPCVFIVLYFSIVAVSVLSLAHCLYANMFMGVTFSFCGCQIYVLLAFILSL